MKEWQSNLLTEQNELSTKLDKLVHYRRTAIIPKDSEKLLRQQELVMYEYRRILNARIRLWQRR